MILVVVVLPVLFLAFYAVLLRLHRALGGTRAAAEIVEAEMRDELRPSHLYRASFVRFLLVDVPFVAILAVLTWQPWVIAYFLVPASTRAFSAWHFWRKTVKRGPFCCTPADYFWTEAANALPLTALVVFPTLLTVAGRVSS